MKNPDEVLNPRLRVVDTTGPDFRSNNHKKKHKRYNNRANQKHQQEENSFSRQLMQQWPIEALPIQQAVLEYGRRTAALSAQQAAQTLKNLTTKIRDLNLQMPAIDQIISDAEIEITRLKMMLSKAYEEEDD